MDKVILDTLSLNQKAALFERDRKIEAVLYALSQALINGNHQWTDEERGGFDWAARTLRVDQAALAA